MKKKLSDAELLIAAKAIYSSRPFVNKLWFKTNGFPSEFIDKNWNKIIKP